MEADSPVSNKLLTPDKLTLTIIHLLMCLTSLHTTENELQATNYPCSKQNKTKNNMSLSGDGGHVI